MKKIFFLLFITAFFSFSFLIAESSGVDNFLVENALVDSLKDFPDANDDIFDKWVIDAIGKDVLSDKLEFPTPTKTQIFLAKYGFPFLNFYFFTKNKVSRLAFWLTDKWRALKFGALYNYFFRRHKDNLSDNCSEKGELVKKQCPA